MKVAIIYTPSVSIMDIAGLQRTLLTSKMLFPGLNLSFEICSYLPQKPQESGISIIPTMVGLSLIEFDVIVMPGSADYDNCIQDINWMTWLRGYASDSEFIGFHEGKSMLEKLKIKNVWTSNLDNPLNGFLAGMQILCQLLSPDELLFVSKKLGIDSAWQSHLRGMGFRKSSIIRKTTETQIDINLNLDGMGKSNINTNIPFLDHMLHQIAKHGLFDIDLQASGDLEIDPHHTMEDCGIILGEVFQQALGDKKGINRMGTATVPMDESLSTVTVDFSGRPYCVIQSQWNGILIGDIPVSLFEHFLESFAIAARCNLFIQVQAGKDNHHMCESIFKALAKALDQACRLDFRRLDQIPSTKEKIF